MMMVDRQVIQEVLFSSGETHLPRLLFRILATGEASEGSPGQDRRGQLPLLA
jgi:hypothetical protein